MLLKLLLRVHFFLLAANLDDSSIELFNTVYTMTPSYDTGQMPHFFTPFQMDGIR